jgi:4-amino-4-deoxy-L-arabinose transferase-like glycosyltransferase
MRDGEAAVRQQRLILGILVLLAFVLRVLRLGFQPLWWDEGWSLYFSTAKLSQLLSLTAVDIHPPLYYLLLRAWIGVLGAGPVAVRLLSVLVGTATVPLLYLCGRRLLGERAGLLAAFLLAVSPFAVYYSQEVRMYGLVTLLGLAAVYFALRLLAAGPAQRAWGPWIGYVLAGVAALYAEYYAAFLLLALNIAVFWGWIRGRRPLKAWLAWLSAQAAVVALFLPWIWYAGSKLLAYVQYKVGVERDLPLGPLAYLGRHLAAFDWGHAEGGLAPWWWLGLLPLAVLLVALLASRLLAPSSRASTPHPGMPEEPPCTLRPAPFLLLLVSCPLLCGFAVNLAFPFDAPRIERLLLLAQPYYLLLVSAGLCSLWRNRRFLAVLPLAAFLAVDLLSLGFFYSAPRYPGDDYRPLAARIRALGRPSDAIVAVHPWQVGYFQSYLPDTVRPGLVLTPREALSGRQLWADDPARMAADLDALLARQGRLWLPAHQAMGRQLEDRLDSYLARRAYPALSEWYGPHTLLSLFGAGQPADRPAAARFGDWLALKGAALSPGPLEAGRDVLPVGLTWQLSSSPDALYVVSLRLADASGRVWAQHDAPPTGGEQPFPDWPVGRPQQDRHGLLVPAGTPPGDYRVMLSVYRSGDLQVLPAAFEGGSGGEVELGTVRVERPQVPPPTAALDVQQPLQAEFGSLFRLLGLRRLSGSPLLPGQSVEVELFWQALGAPGEDYEPRLQLLDAGGTVVAELAEKPVAGSYPTAWWKAGELVRDPHTLPIPAAAQPGRYRLALSLVRAADGEPVEVGRGRTSVDLAEVEVQGREHRFRPAAPQVPQQAQLGRSVELVGYDLPEAVLAPGSARPLTLYWHALATPDENYRAFVHLLDADGTTVAQADGVPGQGRLPALGWLPGEYLADPHALQLPFDLPEGGYRLEVGLYEPASGRRLGERVLLDTPLQVEGP